MRNITLPSKTRCDVVDFCNAHIIPETTTTTYSHPIEWFEQYFDFVPDPKLQRQLANAYYQARFIYKLGNGLRLTSFKNQAIIKFQIQQYASIYEALIDYFLQTNHDKLVDKHCSYTTYTPISGALGSKTQISVDGKITTVCSRKTDIKPLKKIKISDRTKWAVEVNLITATTKQKIDALYDLRNNVHILKAAQAQYTPKQKESKAAFLIMDEFVSYLKSHI